MDDLRRYKLCLTLTNLAVFAPCVLARNWPDWAFCLAPALASMAHHATETMHYGPAPVKVPPQRQWLLLQLDRGAVVAAVLWFTSWTLLTQHWMAAALVAACGALSEAVVRLPRLTGGRATDFSRKAHCVLHCAWHVGALGWLGSLAVLSDAPRWWQ